jgi:hypothetical protein
VAGGRVGAEAPSLEQACQRNAHEEKGRLGVRGQPQLLVFGVYQEPPEIDAGSRAAAAGQRPDLGVSQDIGSHPGVLRALAGKQKGDLGHGLQQAALFGEGIAVFLP